MKDQKYAVHYYSFITVRIISLCSIAVPAVIHEGVKLKYNSIHENISQKAICIIH
jgi:hypothetical protein